MHLRNNHHSYNIEDSIFPKLAHLSTLCPGNLEATFSEFYRQRRSRRAECDGRGVWWAEQQQKQSAAVNVWRVLFREVWTLGLMAISVVRSTSLLSNGLCVILS